MRVRSYGSVGPLVVVLHGGPGAAGSMAPVARRLAEGGSFRVLEPFQRRAGAEPLTVARHVGCGTFDPASRARMKALIAERTDDAVRRRFAAIEVVAIWLRARSTPGV